MSRQIVVCELNMDTGDAISLWSAPHPGLASRARTLMFEALFAEARRMGWERMGMTVYTQGESER